jgi:hypothetical protein
MNDLEKFGKYMIAEITTEGNSPKIVDRGNSHAVDFRMQ